MLKVNELNDQQKQVVEAGKGPYLVISGPGAGKTACVVHRVVHLIKHQGVPPEEILLLTFTRKASAEMLHRASNLLDKRCHKVAGGTFHSFAASKLRTYGKHIGFPTMNIIDTSDAEDIIKIILDDIKRTKEFPAKHKIYSLFSKVANTDSTLDEVVRKEAPQLLKILPTLAQIREKFIEHKASHQLMDYDDLLVKFRQLLRDNKKIREKIGSQYQYIMVDEYQDTNSVQADIVKLLCCKHNNIMVVGDDLQCWAWGSSIVTSEGIKIARDVKVGDKVKCLYQGEIDFKAVTHVEKYTGKSCTIRTCHGFSIETSENHRFYALESPFRVNDITSFNIDHEIFGDLNDSKKVYLISYCNMGDSPGIRVRFTDNKEFVHDVEYSTYAKALAVAYELQQRYPETTVEEILRLKIGQWEYDLKLWAAADLRRGMVIPVIYKDKVYLDTISPIERNDKEIDLYDFEIEEAGNMIADNVLSHNSIYGFRGANFKSIMDFPSLFPKCQLIKLTQNYRSHTAIVRTANMIKDNAKFKYDKELFSKNTEEVKPIWVRTPNEFDQAIYVGHEIQKLLKDETPYNEIAILFRASHHSNMVEVELNKRGIGFVKYGGMQFMESAHVKDLIALIKILYFPADSISWIRTLTMLPRIGFRTAQMTIDGIIKEGYGYSYIEELQRKTPRLWPNNIENLDKYIKMFFKQRKKMSPTDVVSMALEYYTPLCKENYKDGSHDKRLEELENFKTLAGTYHTIKKMLTDLTLDSPKNDKKKLKHNQIVLSTLHSAKGLEFDSVFIINLVEGDFPSHFSLRDEMELEEERRLFYVGVTRAKKNLHLITPMLDPEYESFVGYPANEVRNINGTSRFVLEIKDTCDIKNPFKYI